MVDVDAVGPSSVISSVANSPFANLVPLAFVMLVFYILIIRPHQKKLKKHKSMIAGLSSGDRVLTAGGIIGMVKKIGADDKELVLEIGDGVKVVVLKETIVDLIGDGLQKSVKADEVEKDVSQSGAKVVKASKTSKASKASKSSKTSSKTSEVPKTKASKIVKKDKKNSDTVSEGKNEDDLMNSSSNKNDS